MTSPSHSKRIPVVAVDGPAASGKSSVCAAVAHALSWSHVNTGALYRAAGYALGAERLLSLAQSTSQAQGLINEFVDSLSWNVVSGQVFYKGKDITPEIQSAAVGQSASAIAKVAELRRLLLPVQRNWALAAPVGAIVEGRDIGTVVFPDADLKVFLTASLEQRAKRRLSQLSQQSKELPPSLAELIEQIRLRDLQDQSREVAPFKQASDAVIFDTSPYSFDESVLLLVQMIKNRGL